MADRPNQSSRQTADEIANNSSGVVQSEAQARMHDEVERGGKSSRSLRSSEFATDVRTHAMASLFGERIFGSLDDACHKSAHVPDLTSSDMFTERKGHDVHSVNGYMQLGSVLYEIKNGMIYRPPNSFEGAGKTARPACGTLLPGYLLKLDGQDPIRLDAQDKLIMKFTCDGDNRSEVYQIIGFGRPQRGIEAGSLTSGLVAVTDITQYAEQSRNKALEYESRFVSNRPYFLKCASTILEKTVGWQLNSGGEKLHQAATNLERQSQLLKRDLSNAFNKLNQEHRLPNDELGLFTDAARKLVSDVTTNRSEAQWSLRNAARLDKTIADSTALALTTVAVCSMGTYRAGLARGGAISRAGSLAIELGWGTTFGASASVLTRLSRSSDDFNNAFTGSAEGFFLSGGMATTSRFRANRYLSQVALVAESALQAIAFNAAEQSREGKPIGKALLSAIEPCALFSGSVGQYLGHNLGHYGGKLVTNLGAVQDGLLHEIVSNTANSFTNSATASLSGSCQAEFAEIAKKRGIFKDQVKVSMFDESNVTNILQNARGSGLASVPTAIVFSMLAHGTRKFVEQRFPVVPRPGNTEQVKVKKPDAGLEENSSAGERLNDLGKQQKVIRESAERLDEESRRNQSNLKESGQATNERKTGAEKCDVTNENGSLVGSGKIGASDDLPTNDMIEEASEELWHRIRMLQLKKAILNDGTQVSTEDLEKFNGLIRNQIQRSKDYVTVEETDQHKKVIGPDRTVTEYKPPVGGFGDDDIVRTITFDDRRFITEYGDGRGEIDYGNGITERYLPVEDHHMLKFMPDERIIVELGKNEPGQIVYPDGRVDIIKPAELPTDPSHPQS